MDVAQKVALQSANNGLAMSVIAVGVGGIKGEYKNKTQTVPKQQNALDKIEESQANNSNTSPSPLPDTSEPNYYRARSTDEYNALVSNQGLTFMKGKELFVSNQESY